MIPMRRSLTAGSAMHCTGANRKRLSMAGAFEHWRTGFIIADDWFQAARSPDRLSSLDPSESFTALDWPLLSSRCDDDFLAAR
jgi:hypothetical protein